MNRLAQPTRIQPQPYVGSSVVDNTPLTTPIGPVDKPYQIKGKTTTITVENSMTLKLKDNYYKFSFAETREIPQDQDIQIELERKDLIDTVNKVLDDQLDDILNSFA